MPGDQTIDDLALFAEGPERCLLVRVHEARIALDIGGEDRGQLAFDVLGCQEPLPWTGAAHGFVEGMPLSSSRFEIGPPQHDSLELLWEAH